MTNHPNRSAASRAVRDAAPELLAALKEALIILNSRGRKLGLDDGGPVLNNIRAAIAKAERA